MWRADDWEPTPTSRLRLGGPEINARGKSQTRPGEPLLYQRIDASFDPGRVPTLTWADTRAETHATSPNPVPYGGDGLLARDLGFGPGAAVDGSLTTAWCSAEATGELALDLPFPVESLRVELGHRNPWSLEPSSCEPVDTVHWPGGGGEAGCLAYEDGRLDGVPSEVTLLAPDGEEVELRSDGASARVAKGRLEPGTYTLRVVGEVSADSGRGPCVAELVPTAVVDARVRALLEATAR